MQRNNAEEQSLPTGEVCDKKVNKENPEYKFVTADEIIKKEDILLETNIVKNEVLENECNCSHSQNVEVTRNFRAQSQERYDGIIESTSSSVGQFLGIRSYL